MYGFCSGIALFQVIIMKRITEWSLYCYVIEINYLNYKV